MGEFVSGASFEEMEDGLGAFEFISSESGVGRCRLESVGYKSLAERRGADGNTEDTEAIAFLMGGAVVCRVASDFVEEELAFCVERGVRRFVEAFECV